MIGPTVIQAIIDKSGSNWKGFPFLFSLCLTASVIIWCCIDVKKGRRDAVAWADKADRHDKSAEGAADADSGVLGSQS
jgi:hypothetical protein